MPKLIDIFPDDYAKTLQDLISLYENETGVVLERFDAERLMIQIFLGAFEYLKQNANQNALQIFLENMTGLQLDAYGKFFGEYRKAETPSYTIVRFTFTEELDIPVIIYSNTSVTGTNENGTYTFRNENDIVVPAGETFWDVKMYEYDESVAALNNGADANAVEAGTILSLDASSYDYSSFLDTVENIIDSKDGYDNEPDDDYKFRLLKAASSFTTAGTKESYEYHAKNADLSIAAVNVSKTGFTIYVYILPKNWDASVNAVINGLDSGNVITDIKLTGLTIDNTDDGLLYWDLQGGPTFKIYKDSGKAPGDAICSYTGAAAAGQKTLVEENSSGVTGTMYFTAYSGVDADSGNTINTLYEQIYTVNNLFNPATGYSSVRPLNDVVEVLPAEAVEYEVTAANIAVYDFVNISLVTLKEKINTIIQAFMANARVNLGFDIVISQLERYISQLVGVKQVEIIIDIQSAGKVVLGGNQVGIGTFSSSNINITLEGN
jgi:phage-related baseplate assembly protein